MRRIYKGQSALRITLKTFTGLDDIQAAVIKYRKADGTEGEWSAGVGNAAQGIIFHECIEGDIDQAGWWSLWAFITFADGRTAAGETARLYVWESGH